MPGHEGHSRKLADKPDFVRDHRPFACEGCGTPFGPHIHATAVYFKTLQAVSCERLERISEDVFGLGISQGGQRGHGEHHQTCLAHLAREAGYGGQAGADHVPALSGLWFGKAFDLARVVASPARPASRRGGGRRMRNWDG